MSTADRSLDAIAASYETNSPYFRALFGKYGETMSESAAENACRQHGTTLAQLRSEGALEMRFVTRGNRVETLGLVLALGY